MASKSWGHKVEVLADDQAREWREGGKGPRWACAKCKAAPAEFGVTFLYVTGKAGRVTDRWQAVCRACAEKFAAKHGAAMPVEQKAAAGQ
jgi:hypothetical protein